MGAVSAGAVRRSFASAQARVQARYGALPAEADWRRISGIRGLGAWLEEARGGPLKGWVKAFSSASDAQDIEAGVRGLLLAEIELVAGCVPLRWHDAVAWTRWVPLLDVLEHVRGGGAVPEWAAHEGPLAALLDDDGALAPRLAEQAGIAPLLRADVDSSVGALWCDGWRQRRPDTTAAVRVDLDRLAARIAGHLHAFRRGKPGRAWTLRQELRERLRFEFHRLGLSPAAPFVYLALVGLDLERLRRALLDRALFPESPPTGAVGSPEAA